MAKNYPLLSKILKKLLFERNLKVIQLAREVNIPQPTIHRLVTGKSTRPYKSSLQPIADYFSINVEQLLGEQPLEFIDKGLKKTLAPIHYLPVLPWENLREFATLGENLVESIPFVGKISQNAFATILPDSSMEPIFAKNSLLIFDPEKLVKDRSYVLVVLHENQLPVFRQLLIDGNYQYLKPLNPDLTFFNMRLLNTEDKIISTLVEARQIYNEN